MNPQHQTGLDGPWARMSSFIFFDGVSVTES